MSRPLPDRSGSSKSRPRDDRSRLTTERSSGRSSRSSRREDQDDYDAQVYRPSRSNTPTPADPQAYGSGPRTTRTTPEAPIRSPGHIHYDIVQEFEELEKGLRRVIETMDGAHDLDKTHTEFNRLFDINDKIEVLIADLEIKQDRDVHPRAPKIAIDEVTNREQMNKTRLKEWYYLNRWLMMDVKKATEDRRKDGRSLSRPPYEYVRPEIMRLLKIARFAFKPALSKLIKDPGQEPIRGD